MKKSNILIIIAFLALVFSSFHFLFERKMISGGDYITFSPQNFLFWNRFPFTIWDGEGGLGSNILIILWNAPYRFLIGFTVSSFRIPVFLAERLFWWFPFLLLGIFSPLLLIKRAFGISRVYFLAPILFLFNTYALLIIG